MSINKEPFLTFSNISTKEAGLWMVYVSVDLSKNAISNMT